MEPLFPYQKIGAKWLATKTQALLADDMGLGKSAQAVTACDLVHGRRILVVCPSSVRCNWAREFDRFSPFDHHVHVIMSGRDVLPLGPCVTVISYDLAVKLKAKLLRAWDIVILDEAHYCKERSTARAKAIYGHAGHPGIVAEAKYVWRLTGTPAPNDASELWTHLKSAGVISEPYWDFTFRYCTGFDGDYGFKITGHKNTDELKALMKPFMLRRLKKDVMKELPPITFHQVTVDRSAVDIEVYFYEQMRGLTQTQFLEGLKVNDQTLRQALSTVTNQHTTKHSTTADNKLAILEGMAASLVTLRRYIGCAKVPAVCDILEEELAANPKLKVVLFAVYKDTIELTRQRLAKFGAVTLYGGTPAEKRELHLQRFQKDPKCRVFIGNIIAAGTGVNGLQTAAHEVGFLELDWVPSNNAQAAMRCHRIGQEHAVRVRVFTLDRSVDDQVNTTLLRKVKELAKIV